ncbi:hypothetical protein Aduo_007694 [Ancylostoma duodenale]
MFYFPAFNYGDDDVSDGNGPYIIKAKDLPQGGRNTTPSTPSSSMEKESGGNDWAPSTPKDTPAPATPKYPVFKEGLLRKQCQDSIQEKSPKILIDRLKQQGFLSWSELSVVEKRLVDYNPSFLEVSIDLPDFVERRVKLIRQPNIDQLDKTGHKGGLRPAVDEDFAWLPDVEFVFPLHKFAIRECAVIAFTPPRCFIMCDKEGTEDEERLNEISDGLRESYTRSPPREDDTEIRPGVALVGIRRNVFMRVVVLEADVHKPMKVRCACMDYNAIYSFEREELFPLPTEFSPKNVPVNIFLGRFRGTHYVFKDKYEEVNNAMCQPNKDEGLVSFVTCAIYGAAPDGLTIVDATMPDENGWVSLVMIRSCIAAPMAGDPPVRCSAAQAEAALQQKNPKKDLPPCAPAARKPESEEGSDESDDVSGEYTDSVKSDVEKETALSEREQGQLRRNVRSESIPEEADTDVNGTEESLVIARKQDEERRMFEEMQRNVINTGGKSTSEAADEKEERSSDVGHPEDEVKSEQEASAVKEAVDVSEPEVCTKTVHAEDESQVTRMVHAQEENQDATTEDASHVGEMDEVHHLGDNRVKELEKGIKNLSESNNVKKEQIAKLELQLHRLLHPEKHEDPASEHDDTEPKAAEDEPVSAPPVPADSADDNNNDVEDIDDDVDVQDLHNIVEAYIVARRLSRASQAFVSAMDFSIVSAISTAGRLLIGKDSVSADADEQTALVDLRTAAELAFKDFIVKNGGEEETGKE